jgi:hypothetical protein
MSALHCGRIQRITMHQQTYRHIFPERYQSIVYDWFIRYNPLYFFSALCVLFGMFLVSQGLNALAWTRGQLVLTGVMQVYELLLIAGAALLFRKAAQARPAVILGIMAVVLLFDSTFRVEVATTLEHSGRLSAIIWGFLALLKLGALAWAFRIKPSLSALVLPSLAVVALVTFPQLFQQHDALKGAFHLLATWVGVSLTVFTYWRRPRLTCHAPLDSWGQTVLRRASGAIWLIWGGFYFLHLLIWSQLFGIPLTIPHLTALLCLIPLLAMQEGWIWAGGVNVLAIAAFAPATVSVTALVLALVFSWRTWQNHQKRFMIGIILALSLAVWTINWQQWPLPAFNLWLSLVTAVILVGVAWRYQLPTALLPLLVGVYPCTKLVWALNTVGWGIILLVIGFMALLLGVAFNWGQPRHLNVSANRN